MGADILLSWHLVVLAGSSGLHQTMLFFSSINCPYKFWNVRNFLMCALINKKVNKLWQSAEKLKKKSLIAHPMTVSS